MGIVELCFFAMDYTFGVTEFGAAAYARRSPRGELALKIFLEFFRKSLTGPPGNRLERLKGNLKVYYSIRVNDQWRVIFKFEGGNAYDVRVEDYHS